MRRPDDVIWWQVYPLGFTGAFPRHGASPAVPEHHRLTRLEAWLDYAIELGCSGLALGPIFESQSHGYDTIDHYRIDPRLGDDSDFDHLVAEAHGRGLRILLDGVFNHVGEGHPRFQEALAAGPDSNAARWFHPGSRDPGATLRYDCFEGHRDLIRLNHESPEVAEYVAGVMRHWLNRGADGWRLDAAYAVPVEFWHSVLGSVRSPHPEAWFVAEVIHGDYTAFVRESGVDSVTQYELWKAVWSSLNDGNFFELAWSLERHESYAASFLPLTFVGNHDVSRLASILDDPRHLEHALVVLLTVAGVPSLYYGDEQAFRGIKEERFGGDDSVRPRFPASPTDLAPWGWPTYRLHQRLIGIRRRHSWLSHAVTGTMHLTNRSFAYSSKPRDGGNAGLAVLLNLEDTPVRFPLDLSGYRLEAAGPDGDGDGLATVPGNSWRILSRDRD